MESKTRVVSVESPSSSVNRSAEMTTLTARRNSSKHEKGTGLAHHATTVTSHGVQSANVAILERMELLERDQLEVVARAIGSVQAAATITLHSELSASDALLHVATLQENQVVQEVVAASEEDEEAVTEEEVAEEDSVVTEAEAVAEVEVVSEETEVVVAVVEDSTNHSVDLIAQSRPTTRKSSLTNKLNAIMLKTTNIFEL
jgi:hypothetical protein